MYKHAYEYIKICKICAHYPYHDLSLQRQVELLKQDWCSLDKRNISLNQTIYNMGNYLDERLDILGTINDKILDEAARLKKLKVSSPLLNLYCDISTFIEDTKVGK